MERVSENLDGGDWFGEWPAVRQSNGAALFLSPPQGLIFLLASPTPYGVGCILSPLRCLSSPR